MRGMIGVLLSKTRIIVTFRDSILCILLAINLQTIGRILAFYIPNVLATIGNVASRLESCIRASTGELRLQTHITIASSSDFYTHKFRTIRRILVFYIPSNFSTVVDIPIQLYNHMLVLTGKLHLQTRIAIASRSHAY